MIRQVAYVSFTKLETAEHNQTVESLLQHRGLQALPPQSIFLLRDIFTVFRHFVSI
jgi:hypothetical protein